MIGPKLLRHGALRTYTSGGCRCERCRKSISEYHKKRRLRLPTEKLKKEAVRARKRRYGVDADTFDSMLEQQDGQCAICAKPLERPHVDHCHSTLRVRGLLCFKCNTGLGCFQDDPDRLLTAAAYLQSNGGSYSPPC